MPCISNVFRSGVVLLAAALLGCAPAKTAESDLPDSASPPDARLQTEDAPKRVSRTADSATSGGWSKASMAFPTGDPDSSALLVEKSQPAEVVRGKAFEYEIKVSNISKLVLEAVEVNETVPANLKVAEQAGLSLRDGGLRYAVGNLSPGDSRTIKVTATASEGENFKSCLSANFKTALCLTSNIVSPALKLAKTLPAEVMVCDVIPVKLTVTNTGSGTARKVRVEDTLPAGMVTSEGRGAAAFDVGDLASGESKTISFDARVSKTGKYENKATATADGGMTAESGAVAVVVRQPVLIVTKAGPAKQFIGRPATYEITVTNKGDGVARDTALTDVLPPEAKFESASDGGSAGGGRVQWKLGDLAPGASRKVNVVLSGTSGGTMRNTASAQARCADAVSATVQTEFAGIPALLLECVDVTDPLELGKEQIYVITVTNQGSAPGTNIKIVCGLEDTMQFVAAAGQTKGALDGKTVTFDALPSLAPKAKASWQVTVKAANPGDVRFKVAMTAAELQRPVEETESSNFYK